MFGISQSSTQESLRYTGNTYEYLISQYADDSTINLEDDETSPNVTLELLYYFSDCSGLRANFDKTEPIWIGAKRGCVVTINTK
jgi:hypothetical protein